jgi:hypothetical protein
MRAAFQAAVCGGFPRYLENGQGRQRAVNRFCIRTLEIRPRQVLRRFSLSDLTRGRYFFLAVWQLFAAFFLSL